ncbi:MAG: transglutaminase family protein [Chitinophagales bacterium]|nr:transglutaminase family protein [Chitinophagales bacterium]MDW8272846.1 transglutaminase family protein [Chitinophagales bacterium]
MKEYLQPTRFIDCDHPKVVEYAMSRTQEGKSPREKAIDLYYAVRDDILYSPYHLILDPDKISASQTLERKIGYCIEKSLLLAACGRIHGIPSRLGFSIVRNHLSTEKFRQMLRSDKFVFHGYNEFFLDGKWVKCTPAFNQSLCEKFGVRALDFNGTEDSIFQQFTPDGQLYMEYLHEYGQFADFPYELFVAELKKHYPHFFENAQAAGKNIF